MINDLLNQKFIEECCGSWPNNQIFYAENSIDLEFKKISRLRYAFHHEQNQSLGFRDSHLDLSL